MPEIIIAIVTAVLSFLFGIVTNEFKHKKNLSLEISRKRYELYMEIYRLIDYSIKEPKLVFEDSYLKKFEDYNPRMKLIASKNANLEYIIFLDYLSYKIQEFKNFSYDNNPLKGKIEEEFTGIDPQELEDYENMKFNFPLNNAPESDKIQDLANSLLVEMQVDIGATSRLKKIM
ncbi:hypothetical protein [Lacrimispora sp.]|uniref:hypothetical protein n=1 Tax=Lacrimispora sp. TaxID=2719234 RepID=UPI0028B02F7C|nr:hypothetical protein [Lacrimispora sp.]